MSDTKNQVLLTLDSLEIDSESGMIFIVLICLKHLINFCQWTK
jgi:hypothetical protein